MFEQEINPFFFFQKLRVYSATTCVSNVRGRSGKRWPEENLITQQDIRIVCLPVCFLFLFLPFRLHTWKGYIKKPTNIKQNFQLSLVRVIYQSIQVTFHVFFSTGNWKSKHWCANVKEHPYARKWYSHRVLNCSRHIYFQFKKVCRSVVSWIFRHKQSERLNEWPSILAH